jgi:histidyl-tRNA synthetase
MPIASSVAQVALVILPETAGAGARLATELRDAGLRVDLSLQPNRGVGDQLKQADRKGIPLAVILGTSEVEAGSATVKVLESGEQITVARSDLAGVLRERLARR